ncbi:hypothetical protein [Streptomyces sp. NPDC058653]|uniref:hypothetical protein n=1 Tax=Streptomyces sp. NPDC058653 TaxID=3346576 RepID=UPI00366981A4
MTSPFANLIKVLSAVLVMCAAGTGACFGFALGGWQGAALGAGAAGLGAGIALFLHRGFFHLGREAALRAAGADGFAEGTADGVLFGILLYEAAVFPFTPEVVGEEEREARRILACWIAAYDGLPRAVRLSAAEALEALDAGLDADRARAAVKALTRAVYTSRTSRR